MGLVFLTNDPRHPAMQMPSGPPSTQLDEFTEQSVSVELADARRRPLIALTAYSTSPEYMRAQGQIFRLPCVHRSYVFIAIMRPISTDALAVDYVAHAQIEHESLPGDLRCNHHLPSYIGRAARFAFVGPPGREHAPLTISVHRQRDGRFHGYLLVKEGFCPDRYRLHISFFSPGKRERATYTIRVIRSEFDKVEDFTCLLSS
jgi:hypothetical protein